VHKNKEHVSPFNSRFKKKKAEMKFSTIDQEYIFFFFSKTKIRKKSMSHSLKMTNAAL